MRVLVIGSKGFLGRYVVVELKNKGYDVKEFNGDARNKLDVINNIKDCNVVINLVGIIRELKGKTFYDEHVVVTKNIVDAAKDSKTRKIIQVSALGTKMDAISQYHKTKYAAEDYIISSKLDYTILRPSFLFGKEDKSINYFMRFVKKGFFFVIGNGDYKLQPVYVGDVAKAIVDSIKNKKTSRKIFEIGGIKQYSFNELLDIMGNSINKKVRKVHIPVWLAKFIVAIFERFSWFPFTREQITMLLEGNTCNNNEFLDVYKIELKDFEEYLRENAPSGI